jgi:hypothetical protein
MSHIGTVQVYKSKLMYSQIGKRKFIIIQNAFLHESSTALPFRLIHWVFQPPVLSVTTVRVSLFRNMTNRSYVTDST